MSNTDPTKYMYINTEVDLVEIPSTHNYWKDTYIYRIKGILLSILSLSGPLSDEPDRVSQMIVLIKTVLNTNSPLFCLSVIYIQKSLKRYNFFFCSYRKDFGSKLYLFPCKNYSFLGLLFFSVFWFVKRHLRFKPRALHFQLNYECDLAKM
jgi:hypothetical protein